MQGYTTLENIIKVSRSQSKHIEGEGNSLYCRSRCFEVEFTLRSRINFNVSWQIPLSTGILQFQITE